MSYWLMPRLNIRQARVNIICKVEISENKIYKTKNKEINFTNYVDFLDEMLSMIESEAKFVNLSIKESREYYKERITEEINENDKFFNDLKKIVLEEDEFDENLLEIIDDYNEIRTEILELRKEL